MIDEVNLLCDRLERLIDDVQSLMSSDSKSEKLGQLKEVRVTIERLSKKGLNTPELLSQLEENLAEHENAVRVAASTIACLESRFCMIAGKLGLSLGSVPGMKATDSVQSSSGVTSPAAYEQPIIDILREYGGSAPSNKVREVLLQRLGSSLTAADLGKDDRTRDIVWWNRARWARQALVTRGVLRNDSPHGIWELADNTNASDD